MAFPIPNKPSNYETPIEILWFNNFLKRVRLEREVEVLELNTHCIRKDGGGWLFDWTLEGLKFKTPLGVVTWEIYHEPHPKEELVYQRYLELRKLELKNHSLNSRRFLMDRDGEIASSYNKAYQKKRETYQKEEDIPEDKRWQYRKVEVPEVSIPNPFQYKTQWMVFPWIKPFYLGRILTSPLNNYSERTDTENFIHPLFGSIVEVSNNLKLKKEFYLESLKYYNNLDWFTIIYWGQKKNQIGEYIDWRDADWYLDSRVLKVSFIDPLKERIKKEKDYQEYIIERAQAMEKGFIPKPRG